MIEKSPEPLRGESAIFPVVSPPIVSVLFAVVWIARAPPAKVRLPEIEAVPVVVKLVKLPVDGVVNPIAVPLIPVAVVLMLFEVIIILFPPASIDAAVRPERARVPDDAVKLSAPPVRVKPFEAVKSPPDVTVLPATIEPEVVAFPSSSIVRVAEPLD